MKIFRICSCKIFNMFSFSQIEMCCFFLKERFYMHDFFTSVLCMTNLKNVTFNIGCMPNQCKKCHIYIDYMYNRCKKVIIVGWIY